MQTKAFIIRICLMLTKKSQLQYAKDYIKQIEEREAEGIKISFAAKDWGTVSAMLNSDKIPALELETIIDEIDLRASSLKRSCFAAMVPSS